MLMQANIPARIICFFIVINDFCLTLQNYREDGRIEAKQALGGLPESIWETYSAFANAGGGVILLGVEELPDKSLHALDLQDPQWLLEDLRAGLNNPALVSVNILREENLEIHLVEGRKIITVTVPPAPANLKTAPWRKWISTLPPVM